MTIYESINAFISNEDTDAFDLVLFANDLVVLYPAERSFIRDWFLQMITKPRFSKRIFEDVTLVSHKSFSFDANNLQARIDTR